MPPRKQTVPLLPHRLLKSGPVFGTRRSIAADNEEKAVKEEEDLCVHIRGQRVGVGEYSQPK